MMKWVLPIACVVALSACGQMQQDRASRSSSTGMSSGSMSSGSGSSATGSGMSSGSMANPSANPASANPQPGPAGAKAQGTDPSITPGPTTSGTTQK